MVTGQVISSNNNQVTLNTAIAETDYLRGTSIALQPQGLLATTANPVPDVTAALQGTIGAALGGIGQSGTASETDPGGGGGGGPAPCFVGETMFTINSYNYIRPIRFEQLWYCWNPDARKNFPTALSFDGETQVEGTIEKVFRSIAHNLFHAVFDDHSADIVTPEHPYWTGEKYVPICELLDAFVMTETGQKQKVMQLNEISSTKGIPVYNAHIKQYQNYCANGRRVHNLCPLEGPQF